MPHEVNLRRGRAVGLGDEVVERALQGQGLGGEGGLDGTSILGARGVEVGG